MTKGSEEGMVVVLMAGWRARPGHLHAGSRGGRDGRLPGRSGGRQCSGFSGFVTFLSPPPLADSHERWVSAAVAARRDTAQRLAVWCARRSPTPLGGID